MELKEFLTKIQEELNKREMSWAELGRQTGISDRTFSTWKRQGKQPSFKNYQKVLSFLNLGEIGKEIDKEI